MFKNNTYNGEVWIEKGSEHFCVLEKKDNHQVILKTNLGDTNLHNQTVDVIYGRFIGLGHLTFVGNFRMKYSSGLTYYYEYLVKYCFKSSEYYVDYENLEIKSASFYNDTIAKLNGKVGNVDLYSNTYNSHGDMNLISSIDDGELNEVITECFKETNSGNGIFTLKTRSSVKLTFQTETNLETVINKYNVYKEYILLLFGYFEQFSNIILSLKDDSKVELYYVDRYIQDRSNSIFNFNFRQIESDYTRLLKNWFDDEHLRFVCASVIDNILYSSINPYKRFLNSFYSLEGWLKFKLHEKKEKFNFKKDVRTLNDEFIGITGLEKEKIESLFKNSVRHRDYFVHTNTKQTKIFSNVEAVENSNLFDYVLMLQILNELKASRELQDLAKTKFRQNYNSFSYEFRKYMIRDGKFK